MSYLCKNSVYVLLTFLCLLYGCDPQSPTASKNDAAATFKDNTVIHWKMVTTWPQNFPLVGTAANNFAQLVEQASGGRLRIKVYGDGQLVPAFEVFDAVNSGIAQVGHASAYYWKGKLPAAQFFSTVPFGMTAQEMNSWLYAGGGLELWQQLYAPYNIVPMPGGNSGVQMAGWYNRPINSIKDLQGLKMRLPGLGGELLKKVGGIPVVLPGSELFIALQSGTIDATEWLTPYSDLAFGLHQAAKYYYYPGWHEPGTTLEFIFNRQALESLSDDLRTIIEVCAAATNQSILNEGMALNKEALVTLKEKYGIVPQPLPEGVIDALREQNQQVLEELAQTSDQAQRIYQSMKAFADGVKKYTDISLKSYLNIRDGSE